jgi:hypothetical protein
MDAPIDSGDAAEAANIARLVKALEHSDEQLREERAKRILWASQFVQNYGIVIGRPENLGLLEEARQCFVNGNFIAVLLTALAFMEQTLAEEYYNREGRHPEMALGELIDAARRLRLLPRTLLNEIDKVRIVRNPFTHFATERQQKHRLPIRSKQQNRHPRAILEEDAQLAVRVMFECRDRTMQPLFSRLPSVAEPGPQKPAPAAKVAPPQKPRRLRASRPRK